MCGKMEVTCHIREGFQSMATSALDQLREESTRAALHTLDSATFWLRPKMTPTLAEQSGNTWTNSGTVDFLQNSLLSVTAAVFAVAILIAGMRIAWEQRAKPLQELLKAILTFVVVGGAGTATMHLLAAWADEFSLSIVKAAGNDISVASAFGGGTPQELVAATMPALLAISIHGAVIVAGLIQMVLMLVRSALLVLLAGAFPLAAAATNTEIGRTWFRKFCGWSLAFIAYKPAAALVYAAALKATKDGTLGGGDAVVSAMTGMMMLLLAIFALPALLRFMVPVTAAVAGGGAGMGSSVADPGGLATGAVNVGSSGAGRGSASRSTGSASGGGAGATGARTVGAKIAGPAGVGLAVARKTAGGVAGAAAHSAGESGGGSITPPSAAGPMAGRSGARAPRRNAQESSSTAAQERIPEPVGPSGNW